MKTKRSKFERLTGNVGYPRYFVAGTGVVWGVTLIVKLENGRLFAMSKACLGVYRLLRWQNFNLERAFRPGEWREVTRGEAALVCGVL